MGTPSELKAKALAAAKAIDAQVLTLFEMYAEGLDGRDAEKAKVVRTAIAHVREILAKQRA